MAMEHSDVERIMNAIIDLREDLSQRIDVNSERLADLASRVSILEGERTLNSESEDDQKEGSVSQRKNSRKTKFQKEIEEATTGNGSGEHQNRVVVYNMPPPDFSGIFLDSTDLADFSKFLIDWLEYERTNSMRLEPPRIMSRRLRSMLKYNHGLTDAEFYSLTPNSFMELMSKETKVMSKQEFAETLKNALRHIKPLNWEKVTPATHQKFFQAILRRKEIYLKVFQILMESNSQYCPALKGKEFGLANIFLSTISEEYNSSIKMEIKEINDTNYPKVEDFLNAYVEQAKKHYDVACGVKRIPYKGAEFKSIPKDNPNFKKKTWNNSGNKTNGYQKKVGNDTSQQRLNYIKVNESDSSSDDDENNSRNVTNLSENSFLYDDDDFDEEFVKDSDDNPGNDEEEIIKDGPFGFEKEDKLLVISGSNTVTRGCVNFALYGNCFKGKDCKNSQGHTESVAKETRQWLMKKLATIDRDGYSSVVPRKDQTKA